MNFLLWKKRIKIFYHVCYFSFQTLINQMIHYKNPVKKRKKVIQITHKKSDHILRDLGVRVQVHFDKNPFTGCHYFMVCNHMSYFDILVLTSIRPSVFISSVEMEKTFFLGDIAKLGGTFFVDRINRRKLKKEVESLVNLINQGFDVFLFPEGTSTNGLQILPFKKSLFRVPFQTGFPILPICLKYVSIDGKPFSKDNCDRVCWYDDMKFASHVLQLLSIKELKVEVHYLTPLNPVDFKSHGDLSLAAEKSIRSVYFKKFMLTP